MTAKKSYTTEEMNEAWKSDLLRDAESAREQAENGPFYPEKGITRESLLAYAEECEKKAKVTRCPEANRGRYQVIVGNIGQVFDALESAEEEARTTYDEWCKEACEPEGRASGEEVCLLFNGEPDSTFTPTILSDGTLPAPRFEELCEGLQEAVDSQEEYETSHEDAGGSYAHLAREGGWDYHNGETRLKEFLEFHKIDCLPETREALIDHLLDDCEMKPGHIYSSTSDNVFNVASWPVGKIEMEFPVDCLTGIFDCKEEIARAFIKSALKDDREFCIRENGEDSCLVYVNTDAVWLQEMNASEMEEFCQDNDESLCREPGDMQLEATVESPTKLVLSFEDEGDRKHLAKFVSMDAGTLFDHEASILELLMANTGWSMASAEETGDLTDAPMLATRDEDGKILERFAFMDYAVRSFIQDLIDDGQAVFIA